MLSRMAEVYPVRSLPAEQWYISGAESCARVNRTVPNAARWTGLATKLWYRLFIYPAISEGWTVHDGAVGAFGVP